MTSISTLKSLLIPGTKAVITAHHNPDSDAVGSTLAFQGYLAKKGIEATVALPSAVSGMLLGRSFSLLGKKECEITKIFENSNSCAEQIRNFEA